MGGAVGGEHVEVPTFDERRRLQCAQEVLQARRHPIVPSRRASRRFAAHKTHQVLSLDFVEPENAHE